MSTVSLQGKLSLAASVFCLLPLSITPAYAQRIIAAIPVPYASDVAVNPVTARAYLPVASGVDIVSELTNTVIGFIPISSPSGPEEVAVNPITSRLYVTTSQSLFVVDTLTHQVVTSVNVPAVAVAVNIATNKIYADDFNDNVYVIDGATNNLLKDIPFPEGVENLAVNPVTNRIYVAEDLFPGKVGVINGANDTVITTVSAGGDLTFDVGVDYIHNIVYTADEFGTVSVIDGRTNTLTDTITVGGQPGTLSVDSQHRRIYVDNNSNGLSAIQVINGANNKLIDTVSIPGGPEYSDIDPYRGLLYVTTLGPDVYVVKTN